MDRVAYLRRFKSSSSGTAAIEFALIAPIFLLIVFMIAEYSYFEFKRAILRSVVLESARSIQTGIVQLDDDPEARFKEAYCTSAPSFIDCNQMHFDVRSFSSLDDVEFPAVELSSAAVPTNFEFSPGYQEQIVTVRATIRHNFTYGPLRRIFQSDDEPIIILGYNLFRNEPFGCIDEC